MALFKTKKEKSPGKTEDKKERALKPGTVRIDEAGEGGEAHGNVILKPRITERSSFITEDRAYTFDIDPRANKTQVKRAIEEIYKVKPVKVNIVMVPSKRITVRGKAGVRSGGKKAIVYLADGDKIEFV